MENNEKKVEEICRKEDKIKVIKEWLVVLFFLAAVMVGIVFYIGISASTNDNGKTAEITMLIALVTFAGLIIAGYIFNKFLSKKLHRLWQQKKLLLPCLIGIVFLFSSCHRSKTLEGIDAMRYISDQKMFKKNNVYHHFDPNNTKLFFVKKWNAPAFYSYNGNFNGISYDWKIFRGTEFSDSVYFVEDRRLYSPEFIALVGESVVNLECRFAKDNISDDPRTTAWWVRSIELADDSVNLSSFLEGITRGAERGVEIAQYAEELRAEMAAVQGKNERQKLMAYTLLVNPGDSVLPECEYADDEIGWGYLFERLSQAESEETAKLKIKVPIRALKH